MPKTLLGWVYLVALLAACLVPQMAKADIMECVHRGKLAQGLAESVAEGYALEAVTVTFDRPARDEQEQADMDKYVEDVRKEVKTLIELTPAQIGQKVAETCAFEYGKRHGHMKDVNVNWRPKVTPVASGEGMQQSNRRYQECEQLLTDHMFIARQLYKGKSADSLRNLARTSLTPLKPDHLERVLKLIDEAAAVSREELKGWFNGYWQACTDGV